VKVKVKMKKKLLVHLERIWLQDIKYYINITLLLTQFYPKFAYDSVGH